MHAGGVCLEGMHALWGVHGWGVVHGWGACVVKGAMRGEGGMHGKGGCVGKGACMVRGACMAKGACVAKGGTCMVFMPPLYEIRPVNARAVLILLECILVLFNKRYVFANCNKISSRQESSTAKLYAI